MPDIIEIVLNPVKDPGRCTICGTIETQMQCTACDPNHYLCDKCCDSHLASVSSCAIGRG